MNDITIDGMDENDFRRSIEDMLRLGDADVAASKLRDLLNCYSGDDKILPSRFLTVSSSDVAVSGWEELGERIGQYDRPSHRISAVSIAIANPEGAGAQPDTTGRLAPRIETNYYSDGAFPFSNADRNDLLEGYSLYGSAWQGDFEQCDAAISVEGLDDLYGAIVGLESRLLRSSQPSPDEICAGSLGACYIAVLIHQAVQRTIDRSGLPRPLCVMAGSNEVYPFFDAPVISSQECLAGGVSWAGVGANVANIADARAHAAGDCAEASHDCAGLISIGPRTFKKRPVLLIDPADAETASRHYELGGAQRMTDGGKPSNGSAYSGLEGIGPGKHAPTFANIGENEADEEDQEEDEEGEGEFDEETDASWLPADPTVGESAEMPDWPNISELPGLYSELPEEFAETDAEPAGHFPPLAALHAVWDTEDAARAMPDEVNEDAFASEEFVEAEPAPAIEPEPAPLEPAPVVPGSTSSGHGLRAAMLQSTEAKPTFAGRVATLLVRLRDWLRRHTR